jgi:hypothetical protein
MHSYSLADLVLQSIAQEKESELKKAHVSRHPLFRCHVLQDRLRCSCTQPCFVASKGRYGKQKQGELVHLTLS